MQIDVGLLKNWFEDSGGQSRGFILWVSISATDDQIDQNDAATKYCLFFIDRIKLLTSNNDDSIFLN